MKFLIRINEEKTVWLRRFFPDIHPGMVRLCNKPILEYLVDLSVLSGATGIRIVMDEAGMDLKEYFDDGSRWGINISYGVSRQGDDLEMIIAKNETFAKEEDLLIYDGFFFIHYDKRVDYHAIIENTPNSWQMTCETGVLVFRKNQEKSVFSHPDGLALSSLSSVKDLFSLSQNILGSESGNYVLPGYNNEDLVYIGQNVEISRGTEIKKPVMIGNHVQIKEGVVVGPGAIIGNHVIIDSGTKLIESIVFENTYVGAELDIEKKVLAGNMVISPDDEEMVTIEDAFIVSKIDQSLVQTMPRRVVNILLAVFLFVFQAIPYTVLSFFMRISGSFKTDKILYIVNKNGRTGEFKKVAIEGGGLLKRMFYMFSLDKFPYLMAAVSGRIYLIGNRLLEDNHKNRGFVSDFDAYFPGAFGYSEMEGNGDDDRFFEISERYFSGFRSLLFDIKMLIKTLILRFFLGGTVK